MGRQTLLHTGVAALLALIPLAHLAGCSHQTSPVAKSESPASQLPPAPAVTTPKETPPTPEEIVIRVYDVRDLLAFRPHEPDLTSPTSARALAWNTQQQRAQLIQDLITTIEFTVAPYSWDTNPAGQGTIKELHGQLIVGQTPANQLRLSDLLKQIRDKRDMQITVSVRALLVHEQTLKLLETLGAAKTHANLAAVLTPQQVTRLLAAMGQAPAANTMSSPQVTLLNGDSGSFSLTQGYRYISGYLPKTAGDLNGNYVQEISTVQTGISCFMEAAISSDRRYVIVKMLPKLSHLDGMEAAPAPGIPAEKNLFIQVPQVTEFGIATEPAGFKGDMASLPLPAGYSMIFSPNGGIMGSIPDGQTLAIGGTRVPDDLFFNGTVALGDTQPQAETPANIPSSARYLIFLVQPAILMPPEAAYKKLGE